LDVSSNKVLKILWCYNNHLSLFNLYTISEIINVTVDKLLGTQIMLPQNVILEKLLFSDQSVFNGTYTNYTITQSGNPAPENDYTITDGQISFHKLGTYHVTMTNDAIISNIFYPAKVEIDLTVVDDDGIEENEVSNVRIYPNPTTGQLSIEKGQLTIDSVDIFDIYGRKLSHYSLLNTQYSIDISHLPAGVYFLRIHTNKEIVNKKVIKN
jgi:hypothetical protein